MKSPIAISIRELILVVAFLAVAIASLRAGGWLASFTGFSGIVLVMGLAIVAFVATGQRRAFAIGFIVPLPIYAATVLGARSNELDPYEGRLPTTQILRHAHEMLVKKTWFDTNTGKAVPNYDPAKDPNRKQGFGGYGNPSMGLQESPDRPTFMSLGHMLLAISLAWVGGKFAVYIHRKQKSEDELS